MKYAEKLKDPRWQKKRLEIFERDDWTCQFCGAGEEIGLPAHELNCHHIYYEFSIVDPWQYPDEALITLCSECHENEHDYLEYVCYKLFRVLRSKGLKSHEIDRLIAHINICVDEKQEINEKVVNFLNKQSR